MSAAPVPPPATAPACCLCCCTPACAGQPLVNTNHDFRTPIYTGEIGGVCLAEGGGGLDAASAAASRRAARKHHLLAGFEEGGSAAGTAYQGDIESAEADYDEPEEM